MADNLSELIYQWAKDPELFIEEELKVSKKHGGRGLSTQQRKATRALRDLVWAKIDYHYSFQKHSDGRPEQAVLQDVLKEIGKEKFMLAKKRGISIMSGQGTGKDAWCSWVILWFLTCFPNPKIPCTAPTQHQLQDILWAEIHKWMRNSRAGGTESIVDEILEHQKTKVFLKEREGKEWFAIARTANVNSSPEEQAETLAGFHEDYQLFIIDEATGVPDAVFKPIEGTMTGICNLALIIFNPTRTNGAAINTQYKEKEFWVTMRWNAEDSENVTKSHIEFMATKYGRDSSIYRIRVLGLPPVSTDGKVIPWDWIEAATTEQRREDAKAAVDKFTPVKSGTDVGGGGDASAYCLRQGPLVDRFIEYSNEDTEKVSLWLQEIISEDNPDFNYIDYVGLGRGVYDNCRRDGYKMIGVNVRNVPMDTAKFFQLRDELWWRMRDEFEAGTISIPLDDELMEQLSAPSFEENGKGQIVVESKKKMRARGIPSPNKADALLITFYHKDAQQRKARRDEDDRYAKAFQRDRDRSVSGTTWMSS